MIPSETKTILSPDDKATHLLVSKECGVLVNITIDLAEFRYATYTARADLIAAVLKALSWPPKE